MLPGPSVLPAVSAEPPSTAELRKLFGRDIFWNGDYAMTAAGDWAIVEFEEALRQSIRRRIVTEPGEWATRPDYGVGARAFVKAKMTRANIDDLSNRIRGQILADERVLRIEQIDVEQEESILRISVKFIAKGQSQRQQPLTARVEIG
jgi:phage baseplate assembly protein W